MKRCALLTCAGLREGTFRHHTRLSEQCVFDDDVLVPAFKRLGIAAEFVVWSDPVDWRRFDWAVVRSTWDYMRQPDRFLKALGAIENAGCRLINPLDAIRWNVRKDYLLELASRGVAVVPSRKIRRFDAKRMQALAKAHGAPGVVIKPVVGAGARNTFFVTPGRPIERRKLETLLKREEYLAQPIIPSIADGEISLCFFGGRYSHGVIKRPKRGDFRCNQEFGGVASPYRPGRKELAFAQDVLARAPGGIVYARVDFVRDGDDRPLLMELELIEPLLHLREHPRAAARFARAVVRVGRAPVR